jgi:hypothetical protein
LFWLGVCEFRMFLWGSLGRAEFTKNVIDESSLANPYRQRSSHQTLDDFDGPNGFGIHQIKISIAGTVSSSQNRRILAPYADVFIDQKVCRSMTMTVSNAGK